MEKLTPAYKLLLFSLWYKWNNFSKRGKLSSDGSFYYDDKRLSKELDLNEKTIMRAKRFLERDSYIACSHGTHRGNATKYWVLRKPDKKSPFKDISKPDNLSTKPDNLSLKAPLNGTPNNINNKEMNKSFDNSSKDNLKEAVLALARLKGKEWAKSSFINKGYDEDEISNLLEAVE